MSSVFKRIEVGNWRQFGHVDIELHDRVTILTGANGTGKTSLLRLLALSFADGAAIVEQLTPALSKRGGRLVPLPAIRGEFVGRSVKSGEAEYRIGQIAYSNDVNGAILAEVPETGLYYRITNSAAVATDSRRGSRPFVPGTGAYFPAHRHGFTPQFVTAISNEPGAWWSTKGADPVRESLLAQLTRTADDSESPSNYFMKQALVSWAVFGYGNRVVTAEPHLRDLLEAFQDIAAKLLPSSLGFRRFVVRNMEVVVVTDTAEFPFDALSGGMASLLELGWSLLFLDPTQSQPVGVVIDEAENHLHASMQRALLPQLLAAFPNAQFIVSTHSPLVASSVRDAYVYALRHSEDGPVEAILLDLADRAGTASDVLRDVLGLDATIPVWAEERLRDVASRYSKEPATSETFSLIREELAKDGLEEFAPQMIAMAVLGDEVAK